MPASVSSSPAQPLSIPERFVDADTAAEFLGISRRTLLQKVRAGKIPGHPLDAAAQKKDWRFKLSELDRFVSTSVNSTLQPT
jgi:excisionase family DNA binding protein